jgi:hypothetical protein
VVVFPVITSQPFEALELDRLGDEGLLHAIAARSSGAIHASPIGDDECLDTSRFMNASVYNEARNDPADYALLFSMPG